MNQNGVGVILIVILVAAAALGGYFIYQKQSKPTLYPQPSHLSTEAPAKAEDPTVNWKIYKIYTDDVNGFSFKYPEDWHSEKIDSYKNDPDLIPTGVGEVSDFGYPYTRFSKLTDKNNHQLSIAIVNESFDSLEKSLKLPPSTSVDRKKTLKYATGAYILLDQSSNKVLWIYTNKYPNEFLDKILSTFKFTK